MRETLVEESMPPLRNTPKGTSETILFWIASLSNRWISLIYPCSSRGGEEVFVSGSQYSLMETVPSDVMVRFVPGGSFLMFAKSVRGGGVVTKVR
jgi:hypothetical protein